jgi:hypothetical protein
MAIEVELPDGSIAEFPDGTSPEVMKSALAKRFGRAQPMTPAEKLANEDRLTGTSLNPAEGMSGFERLRSAYGSAAPRLARGVQQVATEAAKFVAPSYARPAFNSDIARQQGQEAEIAQQEAPLMATRSGFAGNLLGSAAPMFALPGSQAVSLTGRLGAAAAEGAAFGALQPITEGESRTTNTAIGGGLGAMGQGIATGASTLARGAINRLEPQAQAIAEVARKAGIKLGIGNLTENPTVRTVINQMERLPFSGASSRNAANQDAFNEAVGATFGAKGSRITPDVFADAKDALGNEFERLTARNSLAPSPELMARLATIRDEAQRLGNSDSAKMVAGQIDELLGKVGANGQIPGRAYQSFDSQLGAKLKGGGDPAYYLGQLREAVREAMDGSISPGDRQAWQAARRQWAALKTVEPLVAKAENGNIPATQLIGRTTSDKSGKARMATGRGGEIGGLARVGQAFFKKAPDSGTADRLGVNLGVAGALTGTSYFSPETAGLAALILGGNRLGLKALSSRALVQGDSRALNGLARLVQPAPKLLPAAGMAMTAGQPFDAGMVSGYDPNDPRYRGGY